MFNKKQDALIHKENQFVEEALKVASEIQSENGAPKYSTTGNEFVDNFASISKFKTPRPYDEVSKDMDLLWSIDPKLCLKLMVYIRMITRKPKVVTDKVETLGMQKGQGLRHEFIMRAFWLAINHKEIFKANIPYFVAAGSWKDIFTMLQYDLVYNGWNGRVLPWDFIFSIVLAGLTNPETTHLVRKYLPTIRTNKHCTTIEAQADTLIGRWIANKMFTGDKFATYKSYRQLKADGEAHKWQQLISKQMFTRINFDTIAGRALMLLVGGEFLKNNNLIEKYEAWIGSTPVVNFTGFVFELFKPLIKSGNYSEHIASYKEKTINAQFNKLLEAGSVNSGILVVRDTSGSMMSPAFGCSMSSFDIAKAMALYFSYSLKGVFANSYAEFARDCCLKQWKGETPCDKWVNDRTSAIGNTNFQSVIDLFITLKNNGVPESDFPSGILCLSDGEFDNPWRKESIASETNFKLALTRLREAGFSNEYVDNFKIILWDIPNDFYNGKPTVKFESFADAPNFFYLGGYDGSVVGFILEGSEVTQKTPKTAEELFTIAMDQELLNRLEVVTPYQRRGFEKKIHGNYERRR